MKDVTPGEWAFHPADPGHPGSRDEPSEGPSPAVLYATVRDWNEKEQALVGHHVDIAAFGFPSYSRVEHDPKSGVGGFRWGEPQAAGDPSANARLAATAPSLYRACSAARRAILETVDGQLRATEWGGPWEGLFEALDGALPRADGAPGYDDHDGRVRRRDP